MIESADQYLRDHERIASQDAIRAFIEGKRRVAEEAWLIDYVKRPPSMFEFLMDDYYLGKVWRPIPGENEGIWPGWKDILVKHLDLDSHIYNLVLTGSLGAGKTSMMVTIILYRICLSAMLRNPQNFYGLSRGSNIVYNLLSVTKEAVKDTAFGTALGYMIESPFFREHCKVDPDCEYSDFRIPIQNELQDGSFSKIWLTGGSKSQHVLGRNLLGVGLDEGNFRLEKNPDTKAYELYDQMRTRIANRFRKSSSYLPAISIISSSALDESSFTEKVCKEIEDHNRHVEEQNKLVANEEDKIKPTQMIVRNAVYKIKRHALKAIDEKHRWFRVTYGLKNMDPFILTGWYKEDGSKIGDGPHEEPPRGARTELVPELYFDDFRRNCKAQLQNVSGISVGGSHRLFSSMVDIEVCIEASAKEGIKDPVIPGYGLLPLSAEDSMNLWDYLDHKNFLTRVSSKAQPIRHPERLRYAHLDLATQTVAGLAVCHLAGCSKVDGLIKDGIPFSEYRLIVEYDFILSICAGATKPVSLEKIQNFIFWLRDFCAYRFGLVTADQYQSAQQLQTLEGRGITVGDLSVDRDKSVYFSWKSGFEDHRIRALRNDRMLKEAEQLLDMGKKFDHDPTGSKDITDAAAGAYWNAINSEEKNTMISDNNSPSVMSENSLQAADMPSVPITIPLPAGYNRKRVFTL